MNPDSLVAAITSTVATNGNFTYDPMYGTITAANTINNVQHAIKGQMLLVSSEYEDSVIDIIGKDEVKRKLALDIANELLSCKHIEFTQIKSLSGHTTAVKARVFVVPNGDVQLLRKMGY